MQISISPWVGNMELGDFQLSRYLEPTKTKQKIIKVNVMLLCVACLETFLNAVITVATSAVLCGVFLLSSACSN